jgi:hypothetical protein
MPWKECHVVDERLRFIARLLDGENMARLCAEFGISRKTGYTIRDRCRRAVRSLRGLSLSRSANMTLNSIKTPARLSGDKHWHSAEAEPHISPGRAALSFIRHRRPPVWVRTESVDRYQGLLLPIEGGVPPHSLNQSVRELRRSATVWRCVWEPLGTEHLDSNLKQDSNVVSRPRVDLNRKAGPETLAETPVSCPLGGSRCPFATEGEAILGGRERCQVNRRLAAGGCQRHCTEQQTQ